jgi:hypothetical protein
LARFAYSSSFDAEIWPGLLSRPTVISGTAKLTQIGDSEAELGLLAALEPTDRPEESAPTGFSAQKSHIVFQFCFPFDIHFIVQYGA